MAVLLESVEHIENQVHPFQPDSNAVVAKDVIEYADAIANHPPVCLSPLVGLPYQPRDLDQVTWWRDRASHSVVVDHLLDRFGFGLDILIVGRLVQGGFHDLNLRRAVLNASRLRIIPGEKLDDIRVQHRCLSTHNLGAAWDHA